MILLKQSLNEDYLGKVTADIATRAQCVHEQYYHAMHGRWGNHARHFTTIALFIKQSLFDYFNVGRTEYFLPEVVDAIDNIATLSGDGRDKQYCNHWDWRLTSRWSWAFVKALATVSERSEDLQMATNLWHRHEDGSANMGWDRAFLLERADAHDSWSRNDCGVVEKWYDEADDEDHYFPYKVFATENEARLFIAELVMKINAPWYPHWEKAVPDILDSMAESYVNDEQAVNKEIDLREKEERDAGTQPMSQVYVINFEDGVQKIGFSNSPVSRTRTKEIDSGRIAIDVCATSKIPEKYARAIEILCHSDLGKYRIGKSEFFNCTNEQARHTLAKYAPITFEKKFIK